MTFIVDTIKTHVEEVFEEAYLDRTNKSKLIIAFATIPEKHLLKLAESLSNFFIPKIGIELTLKISAKLTDHWTSQGINIVIKNNWQDERGNLTLYRGAPVPKDKFSVTLLFGVDQITDAASLADFYTITPELIWTNELKKTFKTWSFKKLQDLGIPAEYSSDFLNRFDKILKSVYENGFGDLYSISEWLYNIKGDHLGSELDVQNHMLKNLKVFGLPNMSGYSFLKERTSLLNYFDFSKDFFNYSLFLYPKEYDKAINSIDLMINQIQAGVAVNVDIAKISDGSYVSDTKFLEGIKTFIQKNDETEKHRLFECDFVGIWNDILKFKIQRKTEKKETISNVSGSPVEMALRALWETLMFCYSSDYKNCDIKEIEISSTLFKHDIFDYEEDDDVSVTSESAKDYLEKLIGGLDYILKEYISIDLDVGQTIKIKSKLLNNQISYSYSKKTEPKLEFTIRIYFANNNQNFQRKFAWKLPEDHMFRLNKELVSWANNGINNINNSFKLPVFHISYYDELLQASAEDDSRQILMNSLREETLDQFQITNLLSDPWDTIYDPLSDSLKLLGNKYCSFIDHMVKHGILSSLFENRNKWEELTNSYSDIYDSVKNLDDLSKSSMIGILTRCFLIIDKRPIESGNTWYADKFEKSAITTILHPNTIEMLEAQIVFLIDCFNYAVKKEINSNPGKKFRTNIWQSYEDLARMGSPISGLLYNFDLNLETKAIGQDGIFKIGNSNGQTTPLSTKLFQDFSEDLDDEILDSDLFRETSESRLVFRILRDYFDLHPHSKDGISISVFKNQDIQPIVGAIDAFIREIGRKPKTGQENKRYILDDYRETPYPISITILSESNKDNDISVIIENWKNRWQLAELEPKYKMYGKCKFSISHRLVNHANDKNSFIRLIKDHFESDLTFIYDFVEAGEGGNTFERVEEFDITTQTLKFPILEKLSCTINSIPEKNKRKRIVSNRQFMFGNYYSNLLHSLKNSNKEKGTVVVGVGDFSPWMEIIDSFHKKSDWVICIDPNIDERLIKNCIETDKIRDIIGFGSGVGSHGEKNFTISTERSSFTQLLVKLKASINSLYRNNIDFKDNEVDDLADILLKETSKLTGLSLVRAIGVGDEYIRDLISYSFTRKLLESKEKILMETFVSLDAYSHWFDLSENSKRPDLLKITVKLNADSIFEIDMHLIECKMAIESNQLIENALAQIDNGLTVLKDAFKPLDNDNVDNIRPDRRYWWLQLHRLIASKTEVDNVQYKNVLTALEKLSDGHFKISWNSSVFAFWINNNEEIKRISSWEPQRHKGVKTNIYAIGGGFFKNLLDESVIESIDWDELNGDDCYVITNEPLATLSSDYSDFYEDDDDYHAEIDDQVDKPDNEGDSLEIDLSAANWDKELETQVNDNNRDEKTESLDIDKVNLNSDQRIFLGYSIPSQIPVYWEFGHKDLGNRHLIIFGGSGQGKTYAVQAILCEMAKLNQRSLIIDYTNGFTPNHIETVTKAVLAPEQHVVLNKPLPINPFLPSDSDHGGIRILENPGNVASRIASLFNTIYNIGSQQYNVLYQAIKDGIEVHKERMNLTLLLQIIQEMSTEKQFKAPAGSLLTKLTPFVDQNPFASGLDNYDWDIIFKHEGPICNIFQLVGMDSTSSKLITEFILWDLYSHLQAKGKKTDPKVIVLDEVQNLDHSNESPLSKYLREGRKFGVSLILATQNIRNLQSDARDRIFMAEQKLFFKPSETELNTFAEIAAQSMSQKREEWITKLSSLVKGECYSIGNVLDANSGRLIKRAYKIRIASLEERFNQSNL